MTAAVIGAAAAAQSDPVFPSAIRWSVEIPSAAAWPPVVGGGVVVVATLSGQVLAKRAEGGMDAWTVEMAAAAPLAADDDLVLVPVEGAVHALALGSGERRWTVETAGLTAPPLIDGGWVILAAGEQLTALSAADGDEVWTARLALVERRPAFHGGLLLVPLADGRLVGLDLESGSLRWETVVGANPTEPFPFGDRVYLGVAGVLFTCLRTDTGSEEWTARLGAGLRGTAAADPDRIYTVSMDNLLRAFRRSNGAVEWKQDLGYRPLSGPIVIGPTIAVPGRGAAIRMFTRTGGTAAALALPASAVTAPGVVRPRAARAADVAGEARTALAIVTGDPGKPYRLSFTGPPLPALPAVTPLSVLPGEALPPMAPPGR